MTISARVVVIGTGWANRVQIPAFQAGGLEVVGIAGRSEKKAKAVAKEHNLDFYTDDWSKLFELDFDLVSIVTPPHQHKEPMLAAARLGKHVLCEKPLALNVAEAREMAEAATANADALSLVDHELRFLPARLKAKELLFAGVIGRIVTVTSRFHSDMRLDPHKPWDWWSDADAGGGILGAIGSHVFDGVRWLLEELLGPIVVRGATLGRVHSHRPDEAGTLREVTSDDIASVTFSVGDAVGTMLVHGAAGNDSTDLLTIRGTDGTLVLDRSLKLYLSKGRGPLKEYVTHLPGIVPNRFRSNPFAAGTVLLGQALADAVESRDLQPVAEAATIEDGAAVQALIDEARALAAKQR